MTVVIYGGLRTLPLLVRLPATFHPSLLARRATFSGLNLSPTSRPAARNLPSSSPAVPASPWSVSQAATASKSARVPLVDSVTAVGVSPSPSSSQNAAPSSSQRSAARQNALCGFRASSTRPGSILGGWLNGTTCNRSNVPSVVPKILNAPSPRKIGSVTTAASNELLPGAPRLQVVTAGNLIE